MAFLAPALLGLLALAGIPLAIHLLSRLTKRQVAFPALFLLQSSPSGLASTSRWRDLLALLLRVLALILLVLAAAGVHRSDPAAAAGAGRPLVVIVDGSASMHQTGGASPAWRRARAAAGHELDRAAGRPLLLLYAGDELRRSARAPEPDRAAAMALLATQRPGHGRGCLAQAVAAARAELATGGGEIVIVGDLARGSLAGIDLTGLGAGIKARCVGVGDGGDNLALSGMWVEPGIAGVDQPCRLGIELHNHGSSPRTVAIDIQWSEGRDRLEARLPANGEATLSHELRFPAGGSYVVEAAIVDGEDALAVDDRRWGVIQVRDALRAHVVSDLAPGDAGAALAPLVAALEAGGTSTAIHPSSALVAPVPAGQLLVTVGLGRVPEQLGGLEAHLQGGGSWLQVLDSPADAALGAAVRSAPQPVTWAGVIDLGATKAGAMPLGGAALDHRLLTPFFGREVLLDQVEAYRYHQHVDPLSDATRVLLRYRDGGVALAERAVGAGRWFQLNCSPDELRSNLAALDLMPLLCDRLALALVPDRDAQLAATCGELTEAPEGLIGPDDQAAVVLDGRVRLGLPGIHRSPAGERVAAAVPADEGDLRVIEPELLAALGVAADGDAPRPRATHPWWPLALLLAAACFAGEMLLIRRHPGGRA